MKKLYQKILKPIVALCTIPIYTDYPSFRDNQWLGYGWVLITLFWSTYILIWGLGGNSK